MPFDRAALAQAVAAHGTVARIVLVQVKGSAPRPAGTSMLVWAGGASGTIGGGQLELQSMRDAAAMLAGDPRSKLTRAALGPAMNQCCGGAVTVVTERFDAATVEALPDTYPDIYLRAVDPAAPPLADSFRAKIDRASGGTTPLAITLHGGWLAEPLWQHSRQVVIHGAGHVGSALARILAPLPQFRVILADPRPGYLDDLPEGVSGVDAPWGAALHSAEDDAAHFIMTPAHDDDLELCHRLLQRDFAFGGLIGSDTKWARFRSRLVALGHAPNRSPASPAPSARGNLASILKRLRLGWPRNSCNLNPPARINRFV